MSQLKFCVISFSRSLSPSHLTGVAQLQHSASAKPLFNQLSILNYEEIFNLECSKLVYEINNGNPSPIFDNFL